MILVEHLQLFKHYKARGKYFKVTGKLDDWIVVHDYTTNKTKSMNPNQLRGCIIEEIDPDTVPWILLYG